MNSSRLLILSLALLAPMLTALAPNESDPVSSSAPAPQLCSVYDTTAHASDHIAWDLGQCWESWIRLPNGCTKTSVHTVTLDDPSNVIVVNALESPDAISPPNTQAKCTNRRITLRVERELDYAPGAWATIGNYTKFGQWNASTNQCSLLLNWPSIPISTSTRRVRLTAQTIRSDGTFAGTNTLAGYITPAGVEPCVELRPAP
jgi:hypothetical protein